MTDAHVVAVSGSRWWSDAEVFDAHLSPLLRAHGRLIVRHGACRKGLDLIAHRWAVAHQAVGVTEDAMPAMWQLYRDAAGPIRNRQMLRKVPLPQTLIAFAELCTDSACPQSVRSHITHGTDDFIRQARMLRFDPLIVPAP